MKYKRSPALRAYDQFLTHADSGEYRKAYNQLASHPDLVIHLSFAEIPEMYTSFLQDLGPKEADYFRSQVAIQVREMETALEGGQMLVGLLKTLKR